MLLFLIPAVAVGFGMLGVRSSMRSYVALAAIALVVCYIAYTR